MFWIIVELAGMDARVIFVRVGATGFPMVEGAAAVGALADFISLGVDDAVF